jgi:prepilin-type N-terminal cleavage/methylation domain-containing protein
MPSGTISGRIGTTELRSPLHRCVAVHHRASSAARRGGARCAFTLIELLVVVAIVALLLAILAPNLQMARQKAIESVCGSTLRGMMVGIQGYMIENRDYFPPWGHVWYRGDRPAVSTAYAAVLNRGKYTGPTWCPNYSEGSPVGVPDRAGDIREIKEAERQDRFGYAYNLQVGNLVQDPATG